MVFIMMTVHILPLLYSLDIPYLSTKFCSCIHYIFLLLSFWLNSVHFMN